MVFLDWLRGIDGMKGRTKSLFERLVTKISEDIPIVEKIRHKKRNLGPNKVYHRMSTVSKKRLEGEVEKATSWPAICQDLNDWIDYVDKFNWSGEIKMIKLNTRRQVKLPVKKRGIREMLAYFYSPKHAIYGK